jgi:HEAT repeat protein
VPALVATLGKVGPEAKPVLLQTLRAAGGAEALKAVRAAVGDSNKDVHTAAIRVLGEWKTAEVLPVLLDLAKTSTEQVDKVLSLRGYLTMAARPEVSAPDKLVICRESALLIQRDDERRQLLGVLGGLADANTLSLVVPLLDQPAVKKEACAVVIAIADKKPPQPQAAAAKAALEKVVQVAADDAATVKRAQDLIKVLADQK